MYKTYEVMKQVYIWNTIELPPGLIYMYMYMYPWTTRARLLHVADVLDIN